MGQLTKKYFEKRSSKAVALSVGDSPQMTPGSLERLEAIVLEEACVDVG
jgi:hypothetical protein